jgi:hypothetical protein
MVSRPRKMRITHSALFLILALTVYATGCSGGPKLVPVSGKLTMNGKALKNVKVNFHPDPDKGATGPGSFGTTDEQGNFTLTCNAKGNQPGAIVGHHRVVLTDLDTFGNVFVGRGDYRTDDPKGPKETPKVSRFPNTYENLANTPFKVEVKEGMSPVTLDVKR